MPIYEFICKKCGEGFEKIVFASDDGKPLPCPACGSQKTERLMSSFSCGKSSLSGASGLGTSAGCSTQGGFS
jgi:putative FmdB family regulatory protein